MTGVNTTGTDDDNIAPPFPMPRREAPVPEALTAARAHILAELEATQGAWRGKSLGARFSLLAAGALAAVAPWLAIHPAPHTVPGVLLVFTGALALLAVGTATQRPALGSILGVVVTALGVVAAVLEATRGSSESATQVMFKCAILESVFLVPAAVLLSLHLSRAHLPARLGHLLAVGCVGLLGSATVWLSCLDTHPTHLASEHAGGALAAVALSSIAAAWWIRRSRRSRA